MPTGFDYHMNLHYSQTIGSVLIFLMLFDYHMNLHYSQTGLQVGSRCTKFDYHMNLHYSQTYQFHSYQVEVFDYHMNLHYSQTSNPIFTEQTCSYITWVHSHDNVFILTFIDNTHIFIYNSYSFLLNNIIIIVVFN